MVKRRKWFAVFLIVLCVCALTISGGRSGPSMATDLSPTAILYCLDANDIAIQSPVPEVPRIASWVLAATVIDQILEQNQSARPLANDALKQRCLRPEDDLLARHCRRHCRRHPFLHGLRAIFHRRDCSHDSRLC